MNRKQKAMEFIDEEFQIHVVGHNLTVTDALRDYATNKLFKLERFGDRILNAVVTMDHQKLDFRTDIVLKSNHTKIKAQGIDENMYASIDKAMHKLEAQLLRYKDKLHRHHAKGTSAVDMTVNVLRAIPDEEVIDFNEAIESDDIGRLSDSYTPHSIVSKELLPLKTLTDGEALMKMNLSQDHFLVYRDEEKHHLRIMYRRNDGNFGVIEPEIK